MKINEKMKIFIITLVFYYLAIQLVFHIFHHHNLIIFQKDSCFVQLHFM